MDAGIISQQRDGNERMGLPLECPPQALGGEAGRGFAAQPILQPVVLPLGWLETGWQTLQKHTCMAAPVNTVTQRYIIEFTTPPHLLHARLSPSPPPHAFLRQ